MTVPGRTLAAALRRHGPARKIGVALSGGGDSVALLHAARELAAKQGFALIAIHVCHHLRAEAEQDARFCARLCRRWKVTFVRCDLNPSAFTGNVHDAARRARYDALERVATKRHLDLVLTAHTLDDQAETLLQRIVRGTGPTGLAGIRERKGIFVRPWLGLRRETLRAYARRHALNWLEDPSNQDHRFLRVRLRHTVLPTLADAAGEAVYQALGRLADLAAQEADVLAVVASNDHQACAQGDGLAVARLAALSPGRRALVLRNWLAGRGIIPPRRVIDDLDHLVMSPQKKWRSYRLPGDVEVCREGDFLNWTGEANVELPWAPFAADKKIDRMLANGLLRLRVGPAEDNTPAGAQLVSWVDLKGARWMPPWPGARLHPRGMQGSVKCSDLFVNHKIPRPLRRDWPLLVQKGEILLVAGLRMAEKMRPAPKKGAWFVHLEW